MHADRLKYVAAAVLTLVGQTAPGQILRGDGPVQTAAMSTTPRPAVTAHLPLAFEPNRGQFDPQVRFVSRGRGYTLFLTDTEAVISNGKSAAIRLALQDARTAPAVGLHPQAGTVNYLIGKDPAQWHTGIVTYERVQYQSVYPGIDLVYYGREGLHEYDLVVGPGADPSRIAMRVTGADRIELDAASGHLQLRTASTTFTMRAPDVYQIVNGQRQTIAARYTLTGQSSVGFALDAYDATAPLVIDPQLIYGTFLGGTGNGVDQVNGLALGGDGAPFVIGTTDTTDFPVQGAAQPRAGGSGDAVVTKLSPDGLQRVYSTYIGGSGSDSANDIAVRHNGIAYIVGTTFSDDFPVRSTAFQSRRAGGSDVFVLALAANGASIVESTLLGGSDADDAIGLEVATFRNPPPGPKFGPLGVGDWIFVYGSTKSPEFPTIGAGQAQRAGVRDAFVTVFDRRTLRPLYSTYVGLEGDNQARTLRVNRRTGDLYLFLYRSDEVGPLLAKLTPFVARNSTQADPPAAKGTPQWRVDRIKKLIDTIKAKFGPNPVPEALEQLVAQIKGAAGVKCDEEPFPAFDDDDFPPDLPPFDPLDDLPLPDVPDWPLPDINEDPFDTLPEPPPLPDDPFPFDDLSDGALCGGGGELLGYRVHRRAAAPQAAAVGAAVPADQLASTRTMVVMPGCFPLSPSTTCNERAVLVFYDKNLDVIASVNFGGQRAGREFIPTAASLDAWGRLHFVGTTSDNNLPVVSPVQGSSRGSSEGFILTLNPSTGAAYFFSYLGGGSFDTLVDIAVDRRGNRWIAGTTLSQDFPVTRSGVQPDLAGRIDGFLVRIVP